MEPKNHYIVCRAFFKPTGKHEQFVNESVKHCHFKVM